MSHYDIHDDEKFAEEFDIRCKQTAIAIQPELERDMAKLAMFDNLVKSLYRALPYAITFASDPQHRSELMEAQRVLNRARALQVKP